MKKIYIKLFIAVFAFALLTNCEKEEPVLDSNETFQAPIKINAQTVSFEEAQNFFNQNNDFQHIKKSSANALVVSPDWNSISHNDMVYTEAKLTTAETGINRKGNYSSELLFIKVDGVMRNVIFTIWKEKVDENGLVTDARVFFNKTDGTFLDAYKIENGKFTKRLTFTRKTQVNKAALFTFLQEDSEECDDAWNVGVVPEGSQDSEGNYCMTQEEILLTASGNGSGGTNQSGSSGIDTSGYSSIGYVGYINNSTGNTSGGGLSSGQITSAGGAILTVMPMEPDANGNCPDGYSKDANGMCVVDDQIYTDDLKLKYPCQSKIIKDAFVKTAPLSKLILDVFEADNTNYNINFFEDIGIKNTGAQMMTYDPHASNVDIGEIDIEIGVNPDLLINGTDLAMASAAIHEGLHAILLYGMETGKLNRTSTAGRDVNLNSTVKEYLEYKIIREEFLGRMTVTPDRVNTYMHKYFMEFIGDLATSISEFGKKQGYNLPFTYYEKLAMIGLEDTLKFVMWFEDEELDQDEIDKLEDINEVLINEFNNEPNAKGEKKC